MSQGLVGARAVVTGGAGFVGSWLCERLLSEGAEVVCVDSLLTGHRDNVAHLRERAGFHLVVADVCDCVPVTSPVDLVFHLASPASPLHYLRLPLETLRVGSVGTTNALELAAEHGARFLLASTSEVYGDPARHPQPEDYWGNVNPIGPRSVYDEAKRFSEATTAAYRRHRGVDTVIARIFNTYGPRMAVADGRVVPTFVQQALDGEPLTVAGDGRQSRSLCYVEDTVEGLLRLALSGLQGPVNIGNDDETTMLELAHTVLTLTGSSSQIRFIELPEDDPRLRRPDLTVARERLGWSPMTPNDVGLKRTVEWVTQQLSSGTRRRPATSAPPAR
ncbi:NAD-dependent epimerase/dehydratase family protein [Nocardioides sp. cx-173]|uniref:NAD-dependent epimerase/dehydratase family protein n=1 Tax=Nocardioides sp. cx-173 TaxID=2898796 RepID=UPI001E369EC1|nr:NAD-dependent epimerase/dehydratase family protein [Nocardioides sp. cx-173]MCD4527378.1 GDP-mannose 4,6-dehydratase [Nocardioides sp. cx-173]UGB42420.1 GDP-mannose 4,6-dehydratase [Nocardioides sp. cx-173]